MVERFVDIEEAIGSIPIPPTKTEKTTGGHISSKRSFVKINHFILAKELRVIDEQGKQYGILSKQDALMKAEELGTDLVEIAPQAKPPVAKLISFSKFKYQQKQKENQEKKKAKNAEIKELRLTPFMADGDFNSRMARAKEFISEGNKARFVVKFKGRQITKKEFGDKILARVVETLYDIASVEIAPKLMGKLMMMQMAPAKKQKSKEQQDAKETIGTDQPQDKDEKIGEPSV